MAFVDPKTKTTYASTGWDQYHEGRPPYPQSLTEVIYRYRHQRSEAGWERLVDIGAGSGTASTNFMPDFKVVHISDPSPSNEEQARAFLSDWAQRHGVETILEYSQATGEEAYKKTGEKQADMAICATAAHFMDPNGLVASIAKMLRPGGTLAVFSYWMPIFPDQTRHFHEVFAKTFEDQILKPLQSRDKPSRARLAQVVERRMAGFGVLDSLPLPAEVYDDPLRVYINSEPGETPYQGLFLKYASSNFSPTSSSRVSPGDCIAAYNTGSDSEAEGWMYTVDKSWISSFCDTFRPPNKKLSEEEHREAYGEWEQVFDEESSTGTVRILWPAYIILATRK